MELFMKGIPVVASEDDVKIDLAKILHKPPFPLDPVLNFDLFLFKRINPRFRGKTGILTLPDEDAGRTFLNTYGQTGVRVKGAIVLFTLSKNPVDNGRVVRLKSTSWRDPERLRQEMERRIREGRSLSLKSFAFGRFLSDGIFSSEFTAAGEADIACDLDRRRVRFTFRKQTQPLNTDDDLITLFHEMSTSQPSSVVTYSPHIIRAIVESGATEEPILFIRADAFPSFAVETVSVINDRVDSRRSQGLIPEVPMPSGCTSLMVKFTLDSDKNAFIHAARYRLNLQYHRKREAIDVHEDLTARLASPASLEFLSSLPFELAFEVEKAVLNSTIRAVDAFTLMSPLETLYGTHNDAAVAMFRRFISLLEDNRGEEHLGRRCRSRRHQMPALLEGRLKHAVDLYLEEQLRPKGRFALLGLPGPDVSYTYHLILTPTRRILEGPTADQSNSVLRRFHHNECFLRVSFQDENGSKLRRDLETSITEILNRRYRSVLLEGCLVAGRRYQLLGYSMSGLKQHTLWFVTPFLDEGKRMDARTIRDSLGDFSRQSHQPARLGARWSQAFSATEASITLEPEEIVIIDDIKSPTGKVMTDGCSPISLELAREIWRANQKLKKRPVRGAVPSAFQYRLSGAKGMVVQDPTLSGKVVCLRPSQVKFDAPENRTFDIQSTSLRPKAMFLNRPLIVLLEYLGSSADRIFELQTRSISEAQAVRKSFLDASRVFQQHGLGASFHLPSLLRNLASILELKIYDEFQPEGTLYNDVIAKALHCAETHILRELKYRAHIAVPDSFTLLGVSDEWDCLAEGEIFASVYDEKKKLYKEITGPVAITRSPQIHPGDVQRVTAVRRKELEHLTNVVVFSCRGNRSLSSCLGGGDLDGDDFNLILDEKLIPPANATPGEYISLPIKQTERPCGIADVVDFMINFIEADTVGQIAISHLRFADREDPSCNECIRLAELASQAVDFQKTGTPVQYENLPKHRAKERPDFLAREGADLQSDMYYPSKKLLGRLYRRVPVMDWMPDEWNGSSTPSGGEVIEDALGEAGLYWLGLSLDEPSAELQEEMNYLLEGYCDQLLSIATLHTISKNKDVYVTESELVSGTIMANWSDHHRRREAVGAMNLQTHDLVRAVRAEMLCGDLTGHEDEQLEYDSDDDYTYQETESDFYRESRHVAETFKRAWAAWCCAESALRDNPQSYGPQSFGLIALGRMLELVKAAKQLV